MYGLSVGLKNPTLKANLGRFLRYVKVDIRARLKLELANMHADCSQILSYVIGIAKPIEIKLSNSVLMQQPPWSSQTYVKRTCFCTCSLSFKSEEISNALLRDLKALQLASPVPNDRERL